MNFPNNSKSDLSVGNGQSPISARTQDGFNDVAAPRAGRKLSIEHILQTELGRTRHDPLDHQGILKLYQKLRAGTSSIDGVVVLSPQAANAKQEIFERNLRLVWSIAQRSALTTGCPHTVMDLFQIGSQRLWEILDRFDETRGLKFSTFAVTPIRQRIMNEIFQKTDDPIPNEWFRRLRVIEESISRIRGSGGPNHPTPQEILGEVRAFYAERFKRQQGREPLPTELPDLARELTVKKIEKIFRMSYREPLSTSAQITENRSGLGPQTIEDTLTSNRGHYFEDLAKVYSIKLLLRAVEQLETRRREVVKLYFGLTECDCAGDFPTLSEIGNFLGIGRSLVGQIKDQGLNDLRRILKREATLPQRAA